jgi:phosphoglycerate kinase
VICIGGAIANTFLKARGIDVADSLVENDGLAGARYIMALAEHTGGIDIVLPSDVVVAFGDAEERAHVRTVSVAQVPVNWRILDIGEGTVQSFANALQPVRTAVWNGPVGLFERQPFDRGSLAVARIFSELRATTVVGGGETIAAVNRSGVANRMSHISTGGGASLEMLKGHSLPAVDALLDA